MAAQRYPTFLYRRLDIVCILLTALVPSGSFCADLRLEPQGEIENPSVAPILMRVGERHDAILLRVQQIFMLC